VYPIVYIDAIRIKVRDAGVVANKAAHLVVGVDLEGRKQVLGVWIQQTEGAKFWSGVLTELRNRGLKDALIVCCDGLTGLPAAVNAVWPEAVVQTCVVHLIRTCMRYVSWKDRKEMSAALRPIYTAPTVQAAELAFGAFKDEWGTRAAGAVAAWERAWEEFTPFLAFAPEIRKIIYTTNLIESVNFQLRKVTKARGSFPTDEAAMKLLYLALRNISDQRGGDAGTGTHGWKNALNAFRPAVPRPPTPLNSTHHRTAAPTYTEDLTGPHRGGLQQAHGPASGRPPRAPGRHWTPRSPPPWRRSPQPMSSAGSPTPATPADKLPEHRYQALAGLVLEDQPGAQVRRRSFSRARSARARG
jgi:putative transposase